MLALPANSVLGLWQQQIRLCRSLLCCMIALALRTVAEGLESICWASGPLVLCEQQGVSSNRVPGPNLVLT